MGINGMELDEIRSLPPEAYLDPSRFVTSYPLERSEDYLAQRRQEGLEVATTYKEVHISIYGSWSAAHGPRGGSLSASETIGWHVATAALLEGFLAGTASIIVHRFADGKITETVIKQGSK